MSAGAPKGIISPWARRPATPAAEDAPASPSAPASPTLQEFDNARWSYVTLEGRVFKLALGYLPCKGRDRFEDAAENFGAALERLFAEVPAFEAALAAQSIHRVKPLGPRVVLTFGPVTLHAVASSRDVEVARGMAVDRLCLALTAAKAKTHVVGRMLDDHKISIAGRTT